MRRALQESRAGIGDDKGRRSLFAQSRADNTLSVDGNHHGAAEASQSDRGHNEQQQRPASDPPRANLGSGLKRPLEVDLDGNPIIETKKRRRRKIHNKLEPDSDVSGSEWSGLDSNSGLEDGIHPMTRLQNRSDIIGSSGEEPGPEDDSEVSEDSGDETSRSSYQEDEEQQTRPSERMSAFKAWATEQRNEAIGFTPSRTENTVSQPQLPLKPSGSVPNVYNPPPSKPTILPPFPAQSGSTVFNVQVARAADVQEARMNLPVVAEEQHIMETISRNDCVIICGSTGSGKTTQVPQFLYEAGYGHPDGPSPGMIGVTQPRRVAAVSMAQRVAHELGDLSDKVSHQIRFDSSVSRKTFVKFMTDGVLLREVSQDFTLSEYSVIIVDEAHERSVNTDILIGMLSRIVTTRAQLAKKSTKHRPLKFVIMSATLRLVDFQNNDALFPQGPPPVVTAEGKQHHVTIHFARKTQRDYLEEAYRKISRGHRKLPSGGMLVFLTSQIEILTLLKRLKQTFPSAEERELSHPQMRISTAESMFRGSICVNRS